MSQLKIQHTSEGKKGAFFIEKDKIQVAEMIYRMDDSDLMVIEHTEVDKGLRGEGIGEKLLNELVEYSRSKNIKVKAECSYAEAMFKKNEELRDVLR
jgi:hypothetical protein